ncbi:hypothetical protein CRE_03585 [Caenorhabditis remanei]|uniref:Peptidase A2 domain-containing protein n=1 Tax=Caenorhabditis remanei TaxID=31234 RepID=E3NUP8_CAERE|nr:hypothetical protein CRE_03585 [Caenorhabditis remanei]
MQNSHIEISKTLLAIDPTLGMRALLKRQDVVAKRAGMVYLVSQCSQVTVDKVYYDHNVNGTCYVDTPVRLQNQTWFIAPGMEKDLVKESAEIPCDEVTLGIYKDEDGNWKSRNGPSVVRNIPITFMKKVGKINLTLSAPPVFNKLENIDNPLVYLATWTVSMMRLKETQIELMRNLRSRGLSSSPIEHILGDGAGKLLGIVGEIHNSIEEKTGFIRTHIISVIKSVVIPILIILVLAAAAVIALKIYLFKKAAGTAISELVNLTRSAPLSIQKVIRRWKPEVHNIMLQDEDGTKLDVFSIERSDSVVTIPQVHTILTYEGMYTVPRLPIQVNHENAIALIDTGASISLITDMMIKRLGAEKKIQKCSPAYATAANGELMHFQGMVSEIVSIGTYHVLMKLFIVEEKGAPEQCVLGMDFIQQLNKQKLNVSFNPAGDITIGEMNVKMLSQEDCQRISKSQTEIYIDKVKTPEKDSERDEKPPIVIQSQKEGNNSTVSFPPKNFVFGRVTVSPTDIMLKTLRPCYQNDDDLVENLAGSIRQCHELVSRTLENSQNETKKTHDARRKVAEPDFQIGDKVVIKDHTAGKLMYQFARPVIITATTASTITVKTERGKLETVHKNRVKKFIEEDQDKTTRTSRNSATDAEEEECSPTPGDKRGRQPRTRRTNSAGSILDHPTQQQQRRFTLHGEPNQMPEQSEGSLDQSTPTSLDNALRRSRRLQLPAEHTSL